MPKPLQEITFRELERTAERALWRCFVNSIPNEEATMKIATIGNFYIGQSVEIYGCVGFGKEEEKENEGIVCGLEFPLRATVTEVHQRDNGEPWVIVEARLCDFRVYREKILIDSGMLV